MVTRLVDADGDLVTRAPQRHAGGTEPHSTPDDASPALRRPSDPLGANRNPTKKENYA